MATDVRIAQLAHPAPRSILRSLLLTLPMLVWSLLMFANPRGHADRQMQIAGFITAVFMIALFFLMMRTRSTYRWRRWFFVSLGVLFPVGFIHTVIAMRGTMGIPLEEMIAGRTPFCFMPIPLLILPAALTKTLVFPGSILPAGGMSGGGIAAMVGIWLALTIVLGKGWCSYACFFGGIEEGVASIPKRAQNAQDRPALALCAPGPCCWRWYCCHWPCLSPPTACGSAPSRRCRNT